MSQNTRDPEEHRMLASLAWPEREPSSSDVLAAVKQLSDKVDALRDALLPHPSRIITGREALAEFDRITKP